MKHKILFLTGTRADYGKMKPLMKILENNNDFEVFIFVCGMHLLKKFGSTYREVLNDEYHNVYIAKEIKMSQNQSENFGKTVICLSKYVKDIKPDMIIIHGDRMDALAGAVVGALNNVLVGHIEGGELSGTIDESIRHAISKFAHVHFVCNEEAKNRLIQLGEERKRIHVIGSPDIDVMMNYKKLPSLDDTFKRYDINFDDYSIFMYHPVTTEKDKLSKNIKNVVSALIRSKKNYVVVYPNNDLGSDIILEEYKRFNNNANFRIFPSLRFEYFLTLLKNSSFIIGNSSAGIRESCVYGIPSIDIGTRQNGRYSLTKSGNIQHVNENCTEIKNAINRIDLYKAKSSFFGNGDSAQKFVNVISSEKFWKTKLQKNFVDLDM